jgi:hypothetical protein
LPQLRDAPLWQKSFSTNGGTLAADSLLPSIDDHGGVAVL